MDSPEEDSLSLSDGDIVHHIVVGLRITLAADRQPCRHKNQNPQTQNKRAFGKGDRVFANRHRVQAEEENYPTAEQSESVLLTVPWRLFSPSSLVLIQLWSQVAAARRHSAPCGCVRCQTCENNNPDPRLLVSTSCELFLDREHF